MKIAALSAFIIFITSFILCSGQPSNRDSLWNIWNDEAQADTIRLKAIYKIAWDGYLFSQPDSAFYFAQMQYDLAEKSSLKKQMAGALNTQGVSFHIRGDYPKALDYYQRSLKLYEEMGDKKGIAGSLINIGNVYSNQGDYPNALEYFQAGAEICEEIGERRFLSNAMNNIGSIYLYRGDYPKALEYYQRCLKVKEEIGDKKGIAAALNNIGAIHQNQGDYPKALDYNQRSLKLNEEMGDKRGIASALNNIGKIYKDQGDYPNALDYYQRSLKLREEIGDKKGIAGALNNIGAIHQSQGDYPKALDYIQRSLKLNEEMGDKKGIATSLGNIGIIYMYQGDYPNAIDQCNKSLELAKEIEVIELQRDFCECLYNAHKSTGNGNKALEYHEQMQALDDSLNAEETGKKLQQMEFQKEMLADSIAKAEEVRLVEEAHQAEVSKKNRTRNILIGSSLLLLVLGGGIYSRLRYVRKSKKIIEKEKDRSNNLLLNILPADIAEELKIHGKAEARDFDMVSILFTDFKGFTEASAKLSAADLVNEINACFEAFDHIVGKYKIEKIKTIGDAYMAAGGLPVPTDDSIKNTVLAALDMQAFITNRKAKLDAEGKAAFEMRVGVHTGPVVAGIVGVKKFQYDIWGDTVNTASRMESSGEVGKVNISQATYELLKDEPGFTFEFRGKIEAKGKGEIEMFFVSLR